jgi:TRAP-type C4-dicarboxylate transport system permease large subunit
MLVIYAVIVEESVGKLLLAGFVSGLISAIIDAACIIVRVKLNPELAGTLLARWPGANALPH